MQVLILGCGDIGTRVGLSLLREGGVSPQCAAIPICCQSALMSRDGSDRSPRVLRIWGHLSRIMWW
jgi:hypothetical protein